MLTRSGITTIGSTMRDIFVYTDAGAVVSNPNDPLCSDWIAFERAAKPELQRMIVTYGGGAANTAVTFARFGLKPSIITAVGDDAAGLDARIHLQREGVSLRLLQRVQHEQTGTALIINVADRQSHVALVYRGASAQLRVDSAITRSITTPWIYLTALGGEWKKALRSIVDRVQQRGISLAWNPGAQQIAAGLNALRASIGATEVFMVNRDEALDLAMRAKLVSGSVTARALARVLSKYGARYTVVTDGHRGAYVQSGKHTFYQKAKLGKTVNKTGAGDAFGSGLVTGLIRFGALEPALKLAAYNSHAVVGHIGAQTGILRSADLRRRRII